MADKKDTRKKPAQKKVDKKENLLDMDEAIEILKTTRPTFYRWLRAGKIKGMKVGRQWRFYPEDINQFLKGEPPRIDAPVGADRLVKNLQDYAQNISKKLDWRKALEGPSLVVELMIQIGLSLKASDIHLTIHYPPGEIESHASLRYRVDGVLKEVVSFD